MVAVGSLRGRMMDGDDADVRDRQARTCRYFLQRKTASRSGALILAKLLGSMSTLLRSRIRCRAS